MSRYIGVIPHSDDTPCAVEHSISGGRSAKIHVSSAMIAKVGAAANDMHAAAPGFPMVVLIVSPLSG
jgi:hypothetical protein